MNCITNRIASILLACTATSALAVEINNFTTPDAWTRGGAATTYYGWDIFEGGPTLLNDATPDINPFAIAGVAMLQNNATFANVRASTNLYAGPFDVFDITADLKTAGTAGSGFTTILVQIAGSVFGPGQTPAGFAANSFLINGQTPDFITNGYIADNRNLWWMEWKLAGNQSAYQLEIDTEATSASLSKITIDTAWSAASARDNTNVTVVPEPGSLALLGAVGTLFFASRRRIG